MNSDVCAAGVASIAGGYRDRQSLIGMGGRNELLLFHVLFPYWDFPEKPRYFVAK